MTVCKFWLQDKCKFGLNCRFDHPPKGQDRQASNQFGGSSFGTQQQPQQSGGVFARSSQPSSSFGQSSTSNAGGSNAFGGPSFPSAGGAFGRPSQTNSNPFGTPSQPASDPFGRPSQASFGQASQPTSGFGQPSAPSFGQASQPSGGFGGQTAAPAFGQASQPVAGGFGQTAAPAFGQASQPMSGFGKPSAPSFGQASQPSSGFGQASQPTSGFGQSAAPSFGQASQPAGAFGNQATPSFGQTTNPVSSFGNTYPQAAAQSSEPAKFDPFGRPQQSQSPSFDPFSSQPAQTSGTGWNAMANEPPGQAGQNRSGPFGASSQPTTNAFGGASGNNNQFTNSNVNGPGRDETGNPVPFPIKVLNPYPPESKEVHPDLRSYSVRDASNRLIAWKGKPVSYIDNEPCYKRDDDGTWEKIRYPDGPPAYNEDTELPEMMYDEKTKEAYLWARDHDGFKDDWMPSLPPRREWCRWDF